MKATQKNFASQMVRAAADAVIFYFCGPDEAGAASAAARLSAHIAEKDGPFEQVEIGGAELRRDPVRLADEARSVSLFGDQRQIHVRCTGDEAYDAVEILLASPVKGWPVVIVATSATDKSRTAKLLSERPDALVAMFHEPDLRSVTLAVREMADPVGLLLTDELAERIARGAALDVRMARGEIEKLALYLDADPATPRKVDAAALDVIAAPDEDDSFMPIVNTVLGGDTSRLAGELLRLHELEINTVGLLLAFERRAAQLVQLAARMRGRSDINAFLEQEMAARRVFFRDKPDLAQQLRRWRGRKLGRLIERLASLHRQILSDNRNGEIVISHGLAEIARAAAR